MVTMTLDKPKTITKTKRKFIKYSADEMEILRQNYNGTPQRIEYIRRLIKYQLGIERSAEGVQHKAGLMGLTRIGRPRSWTPEKVEELLSLLPKFTVREISSRIGKSVSSIQQECAVLKVSTCQRESWYFLKEVAEIFGVTNTTVIRWTQEGKLKCERLSDNRLRFEKLALKKFIRRYPSALTGRNIDIMQLVEILCGLDYD